MGLIYLVGLEIKLQNHLGPLVCQNLLREQAELRCGHVSVDKKITRPIRDDPRCCYLTRCSSGFWFICCRAHACNTPTNVSTKVGKSFTCFWKPTILAVLLIASRKGSLAQ